MSVTNYEPEPFETYCPKALVLIGQLQDTLADRCIEIRMERRADTELARFRLPRVQAEVTPLRQEVITWAKEHAGAVQGYYQDNDLPFLRDREAELWLPLVASCQIAAPDRIGELEMVDRQLAELKSASGSLDWGIQLLTDVRSVFNCEEDRLSTLEILGKLNSIEESPWSGWFNGRGLNSHSLARVLRPFGIQPQNIRLGERVVKGYLRESFEDAWGRYLSESATPLQVG